MSLLTAYTHDSELQAITTPPLTSIIHKLPQHPLSLFQPAVSSVAVPCQRLLTVQILQLHALKFFLHRLPHRTDVAAQVVFLITPWHWLRRNTRFTKTFLLLRVDSLLRESIYRAVAQKRPCRNFCLSSTLIRKLMSTNAGLNTGEDRNASTC
jgi:hypothetical protein